MAAKEESCWKKETFSFKSGTNVDSNEVGEANEG
jgi:hypothetical protein